jgi:hypothetical protein
MLNEIKSSGILAVCVVLSGAAALAVALGGCGAAGTGIIVEPPSALLSDFEDIAQATITRNGGRNGYWTSGPTTLR